jgi:hypothetical protein
MSLCKFLPNRMTLRARGGGPQGKRNGTPSLHDVRNSLLLSPACNGSTEPWRRSWRQKGGYLPDILRDCRRGSGAGGASLGASATNSARGAESRWHWTQPTGCRSAHCVRWFNPIALAPAVKDPKAESQSLPRKSPNRSSWHLQFYPAPVFCRRRHQPRRAPLADRVGKEAQPHGYKR